jgi:hypothetical protein
VQSDRIGCDHRDHSDAKARASHSHLLWPVAPSPSESIISGVSLEPGSRERRARHCSARPSHRRAPSAIRLSSPAPFPDFACGCGASPPILRQIRSARSRADPN